MCVAVHEGAHKLPHSPLGDGCRAVERAHPSCRDVGVEDVLGRGEDVEAPASARGYKTIVPASRSAKPPCLQEGRQEPALSEPPWRFCGRETYLWPPSFLCQGGDRKTIDGGDRSPNL